MAQIKIVVCDECGAIDRPTIRYVLGKGMATRFFDLCVEHARPLERILELKPGARQATVTT
ncbi:hypothetical protein [Ruania rhizosphaerae]|uniref:hypothetical protein n=1 Tax=Ruania rhizosphaerae TaxID=1840413 RepID=UPI001357B340|nr:hypothetical protein [Ruania rhizosphaerae]